MRPCEAGSASANGLCTGQDQLPPLKKSQDELVPQKSCGAGYEQVPEGRISSHLKKGNYGAGYELVPGGRISSYSSQI